MVEGVMGHDKQEKQAARCLTVLYTAIGDQGTSGLADFIIQGGEGKGRELEMNGEKRRRNVAAGGEEEGGGRSSSHSHLIARNQVDSSAQERTTSNSVLVFRNTGAVEFLCSEGFLRPPFIFPPSLFPPPPRTCSLSTGMHARRGDD